MTTPAIREWLKGADMCQPRSVYQWKGTLALLFDHDPVDDEFRLLRIRAAKFLRTKGYLTKHAGTTVYLRPAKAAAQRGYKRRKHG